MPYEEWMQAVDAIMVAKFGITSGDIADQTWADWHLDGLTPAEAVDSIDWSDEGFDPDDIL